MITLMTKTKSMLAMALAAVVAPLVASAPVLADFQTGYEAFEDRDYAGALAEFLPLAEQGDSRAQTLLGVMFRTGLLGMHDYDNAARWFRMAAERDEPDAHYNLGLMYFQHEAIPPDTLPTPEALGAAAVAHFGRAAELGHPEAQLYMGHIYAEGLFVTRDRLEAFKWYQLAAWERNSLAAAAMDRLAARMTPAQLAEAKDMARAWEKATRNLR